MIDGWGISCEIALIWMSLDFMDDQSTLVQVMAWCHQATSHYLSQCWPRSLSPYGVTRPQWVKPGAETGTSQTTLVNTMVADVLAPGITGALITSAIVVLTWQDKRGSFSSKEEMPSTHQDKTRTISLTYVFVVSSNKRKFTQTYFNFFRKNWAWQRLSHCIMQ